MLNWYPCIEHIFVTNFHSVAITSIAKQGKTRPWCKWSGVCHTSQHIDRLVQERRDSSALAMELRLSYTNPSIWLSKSFCAAALGVTTWKLTIKKMVILIFQEKLLFTKENWIPKQHLNVMKIQLKEECLMILEKKFLLWKLLKYCIFQLVCYYLWVWMDSIHIWHKWSPASGGLCVLLIVFYFILFQGYSRISSPE